ncbi:MAG: hypothetical protein KIS94_05650 [Chitinophagales bacterium]|nr:hypothetical protein [Chitinophagales bacterium]
MAKKKSAAAKKKAAKKTTAKKPATKKPAIASPAPVTDDAPPSPAADAPQPAPKKKPAKKDFSPTGRLKALRKEVVKNAKPKNTKTFRFTGMPGSLINLKTSAFGNQLDLKPGRCSLQVGKKWVPILKGSYLTLTDTGIKLTDANGK